MKLFYVITCPTLLQAMHRLYGLRLKVKLQGKDAVGTDALGGLGHLSLEDDEEDDQGMF